MKHGHVTPILDAALISRDDPAHLLVIRKEVLHLRNLVWKATSVKHMFQSGMSERDDGVNEV